MKKRLLLIGSVQKDLIKVAGLIEKEPLQPVGNAILYQQETIMVPSAYLRSPWMTKHIISTQQNAYALLMLASTTYPLKVYSPNFAKAFRIPSMGLVLFQEKDSLVRLNACLADLSATKPDFLYELNSLSQETVKRFIDKLRVMKKEDK
ncbi:EutP/PduV family microcompartment system protein [Streptococcus dysgalactiae]|uniref:EutP/PduV family microcompartment system protein n=1 Tax=Streptococcus dysgalactiae TaxID=1334 RepID=UPI003D7157FB